MGGCDIAAWHLQLPDEVVRLRALVTTETELIQSAARALELMLSTDTDEPTYLADCAEAESVLQKLQAFLERLRWKRATDKAYENVDTVAFWDLL